MATRVIFKHEGEQGGEAIGPVEVVTGAPEPGAGPPSLGRPYQRKCACGGYEERAERSTRTNEWGYALCPDCGAELPRPWVTRAQAEEVAAEHRVALEEM